MRTLRMGTLTNLRVIEPHSTGSSNTHTSSLRFCAYSTSIDRTLPHMMPPTIDVRQDTSRIIRAQQPNHDVTDCRGDDRETHHITTWLVTPAGCYMGSTIATLSLYG